MTVLGDALPDVIDARERNQMAYNLVTRAMDEVVGVGSWKTEKRSRKTGPGLTTYVVPTGGQK
jgi:hypothetical protein